MRRREMNKKLIIVCLTLVVAAISVPASAAPLNTPFLSVDLNGGNGPTQPGWTGWNFANPPGGNSFSTTFSDGVSVTLSSSPGSTGLLTRDRGNPSPNTNNFDAMYEDFVGAGRNSSYGLGWNALEFAFSGLVASAQYEFTFFCFDRSGANDTLDRWLMGTTDPYTYIDPATGYAHSYTPATVSNNFTPYLATINPGNGLWPSTPYQYSASFFAPTDGNGNVTIYVWSDTVSFSNSQTASIVDGFQIGVPEPATIALLSLGGLALLRRKRA
jgi:hypothetical protein